jgi:NADH-quinone oxidoreductase subunit N
VNATLATLKVPHVAYSAIAPEIVVTCGALGLLALAALSGRKLSERFTSAFTALTALVSLGFSLSMFESVTGTGHAHTAIDAAVAVDGFAALVLVVVSASLFLVAISSASFLHRNAMEAAEFSVLLMLSASGAMLMGQANDLIVLFLGLEVMSIALYVLAGSNLRRIASGEAAIKYFVLGAFSSAIFLYGVALTYGATGSTSFGRIASFLAANLLVHDGVLLAGMGLMVVGLGFKVATVPFHTWAPDVYQGSPTPAVSFMAAVAKAGGFAGLLRVLFSVLSTQRLDWQPVIWVLAVASLVVGAVLAVVQRDVKRMLAYSSISHAGFIVIGLQAASRQGISAALYYLVAYSFMVIGSFTVAQVVGGPDDSHHDLEDYRGLVRRQPFLAVAMAVLLLAQAGVPFTTGFIAKFGVLAAAVGVHSYALALIGIVSAVIAAYFYLRVVAYMFSEPAQAAGEAGSAARLEGGKIEPVPVPFGAGLSISLCVAVTVVMGIWAGPLVDFARAAKTYF